MLCAQLSPKAKAKRTPTRECQAAMIVPPVTWGTGRKACATERQFKGAGETPAVRKKLIRVAYAEPVDCVGAAGLR